MIATVDDVPVRGYGRSAMTTSTGHLSGVITAAGDAIAADETNANVRVRASATGRDGVATTVALGRHTVATDEPPALGGDDTAPNPIELYLASLLSCQLVTWRFWAERLGVAYDHIEARADGDVDVRGFFGLDDAVRPGFGEIRVAVTVRGPESDERYRELQEAVDAHCPVLDSAINPTAVRTTVETATA